MSKWLKSILCVMLTAGVFTCLFPQGALAIPVEPARYWVQKDSHTGKTTIQKYNSILYRLPAPTPAPPVKNSEAQLITTSRSNARPDARDVLSTANSLLGKPYSYGASGPNSFDCSGFTSYVFNQAGISLPRTVADQANVGVKVAKNELRPGDLVFFSYYGGGSIQHVGIYAGGGKFIHSSSSKGVIVTSLSQDYYVTNYKGASRLLF